MKKNNSISAEFPSKEKSNFSVNSYLFNFRDSVFTMLINMILNEEPKKELKTNITTTKTSNINQSKNKNIINNKEKKLSQTMKDVTHSNHTNKNIPNKNKAKKEINKNKNKIVIRNENNKLHKFFISKQKKDSIDIISTKKIKRGTLFNIIAKSNPKMNFNNKKNDIKGKTINSSILKKNHSRNNLDLSQLLVLDKKKDKNNNDLLSDDKITNSNNNLNTKTNIDKVHNLKMSQKIHLYVENILEKIPNVKKKNTNTNTNANINIISNDLSKSKKEEKEKGKENKIFNYSNNVQKSDIFLMNKNRKNNSYNFLNETIFKSDLNKKKINYINYRMSYQNCNKYNNDSSNNKYKKNKSGNSEYFINEFKITERASLNISLNNTYFRAKKSKRNTFQKVLFHISNIKFKHLLVSYLDQKSIVVLSSLNKVFHKNFRNLFFNYLSNKLLSEDKDILINKILRSIFKYSSFGEKNIKEIRSFYESMKHPNNLYINIINNDLSRTFPEDRNFKEGNRYYQMLFNLLTCYSNYNKNIGYAQGLNFLFGNAIYLFSSEEDIFLFVDGFINFLKLENFLGIDNQKNLPEEINHFSNILQKYIPHIINVFNKKFVKIEIFLTNWLLTIFSCSMNRRNLILCWCFMILFGWKFFYCFVIQILVQYQKIIFDSNEIELCNKMKNILHSDEFNKDINAIIIKTIDFMKEHIIL